jgi:two-component system LytT family response regulator
MIKAAIVDDETFTLQVNKKLIERSGQINIIYSSEKPTEAWTRIIELQPDVLFVDIEMPGMTGFELIEKISDHLPYLEVVFVTSYNEYAVRAFEVNAMDYLLKPLVKSHVERVINRLQFSQQTKKIQVVEQTTPASLQLFGNFKLIPEGKDTEVKWKHSKAEELFIFFLFQVDQRSTKEMIIDHLWPEMLKDQALVNLNSTIYRIKKIFTEAQTKIAIHLENGQYRLDLQATTSDLTLLEELLKGNPDELTSIQIRDCLSQLKTIYQGPLLQVKNYTWLSATREYFHHKVMMKYKQCIRNLLMRSEFEEVEKWISQLLLIEPIDEELHGFLLEAYYVGNQYTAFLTHYAKFAKLLHDEFGIKPNERYQAWHLELNT